MKVIGLNPDWSSGFALMPTDTMCPPKSFPIEWGYLQYLADQDQTVDFNFFDFYMKSKINHVESRTLSDAEYVVISTTPSYLFWRCPPLNLDPVKRAVAIARRFSRASIVLIGPHGTILPEATLQETAADYAFRGEPEQMLFPELKSLQNAKPTRYLASLRNPRASTAKEVSGLGIVRYSESAIADSEPHTWISSSVFPRRGALIETARGCSFDCPFCLRSGFRRTLRVKSLQHLSEELDQLSRLGINYVYLIDENFGLPKNHAVAVQKLLFQRRIKFGIQTRADIWSKRRIESLAASGCIYVEIGMEAIDRENVLATGKYAQPDKALQNMEIFKLYIPVVGLNAFDFKNPDVFGKANIALTYDSSGAPVSPFIPYPTTPWGDRSIARYQNASPRWEQIADLHSLYSILSREGELPKLLRKHYFLRRFFLHIIRMTRFINSTIVRFKFQSRHERLNGPST
jgi:anaerobic magnesium-protoporphyrin IX monomethyl ester cyclase